MLSVVVLIDGGKYDEFLAIGGEIYGWCGVCFIVEGIIGAYSPSSSLVVGAVDLLLCWRMLIIPRRSFLAMVVSASLLNDAMSTKLRSPAGLSMTLTDDAT